MTSAPHFPGFTIQRLLGRGNSANVYLAQDEKGRRVALKLPFPETLASADSAERFANEVRLSLKLRHDRLVIGYAGTPFGEGSHLSMRYFPEGTLARWLDLGQLSTEEALRILADVARALVFLHSQGVIHQDVKPQNVYLDAGQAALGDFGAAYFVTQGGKTAGSPFYMAPEIYRTEGSSTATDVYSLGVLAYELLAHERPFVGRTYEELMMAHLSRFPRPLSNLAPEIPRSLAHLVERAFAKNPQERPDALSLTRAFDAVLGVNAVEDTHTTEETTKPTLMGRHGPKTEPGVMPRQPSVAEATKASAKTPEPSRAGFWNPFKKRSAR